MYQKRLAENKPIGLHEFLYPLLQGYDSVAMDVDAELGGTDQTFNMLAGRDAPEGDEEQGEVRAHRSAARRARRPEDEQELRQRHRRQRADPYDMYGKMMSLRDDLIVRYFELVTDVPEEEIEQMTRDVALGAVNPMALKKRLAERPGHALPQRRGRARRPRERFVREVQQREIPAEMPTVELPRGGEWPIVDLLVAAKLATGRNDAKRLIEGGSVQVDGEKVADSRAASSRS